MWKTIMLAMAVVVTPLNAATPVLATVENLGWLAGHWRSVRGDSVVEEGWLGPSGGTMLGLNRTVRAGRTTDFEYLRIEEREGALLLLASPDGRCPATEFTLIELSESGAVFANPEHDFPQRIIYRRDEDALVAAIEGSADGETRRIEWIFRLMP
jgi:hypothetical protein